MVIVHEEEAGSKEKLLSKDIRKGGEDLKAKRRELWLSGHVLTHNSKSATGDTSEEHAGPALLGIQAGVRAGQPRLFLLLSHLFSCWQGAGLLITTILEYFSASCSPSCRSPP